MTGKKKLVCLIVLLMLCLIIVLITPVSAVTNVISSSDTVFFGEKSLDVSSLTSDSLNALVHLDSLNALVHLDPSTNQPDGEPIRIQNSKSFDIDREKFKDSSGNVKTGSYAPCNFINPLAYDINKMIKVQDPIYNIKLLNINIDNSTISEGVNTILFGSVLNFKIDTNLDVIRNRSGFEPGKDQYFSINVSPSNGASPYSNLVDKNNNPHNLFNFQPYYGNTLYWRPTNYSDGWDTGNSNQGIGTYFVSAECNVNNMGYKSTPQTISVTPEVVTISADQSSITRGKPVTTTIQGMPNTDYQIWVEPPTPMDGKCCSQPPMIIQNQRGVSLDPVNGPYTIGNSAIDPIRVNNNYNVTIRNIVPPSPNNGVNYYANVKTTSQGTITVQWDTTRDTATGNFNFYVQRKLQENSYVSAVSSVTVSKGTVSISINNTNVFLGDNIWITGTNTEYNNTYLFLTGPSQPKVGGNLTVPREKVRDCNFYNLNNQYPCEPCTSQCCDPSNPEYPANEKTFTIVPVINGTWQYMWSTKDLAIDLGQYTIYAESRPRDADRLANPPESDPCTAASTVQIVVNGPTISAIVQPDQLKIDCNSCPSLKVTGITTGDSNKQIQIWIFGQDMVADQKYILTTENISVDGTYSVDLKQILMTNGSLSKLLPGPYTVIVQHPGYNQKFDVNVGEMSGSEQWVISNFPNYHSKVFQIDGPGRLKGKDASDALISNVFNVSSPLRVDDIIAVGVFSVGGNTTFDGKIHLQTGWNFVSTPKTLSKGNNTAAQVFGGISTGGKGIFNYDAKARVWNQLSSTDEIKPLEAYWIYSTVPTDVSLIFMNDPFLTPPTKHLEKGWNAIGYTDIISQTARDTLLSVNSLWVRALGYDATNQQWDNEISNSNPSNLNNMYPTKGYWLYMNDGGDLIALTV